ncbi:MAG: hypothetical protein SWN10_24860, partial [Pseudomonadota bacterium]|nr:hypothetical protein [Pseudomonadota bacterium]
DHPPIHRATANATLKAKGGCAVRAIHHRPEETVLFAHFGKFQGTAIHSSKSYWNTLSPLAH